MGVIERHRRPVPLYTPAEYSSSSVGHLDDETVKDADPNSINAKKLMNAADGEGLGVRTLSPVEIGILKDLGYTMASAQNGLWRNCLRGFRAPSV